MEKFLIKWHDGKENDANKVRGFDDGWRGFWWWRWAFVISQKLKLCHWGGWKCFPSEWQNEVYSRNWIKRDYFIRSTWGSSNTKMSIESVAIWVWFDCTLFPPSNVDTIFTFHSSLDESKAEVKNPCHHAQVKLWRTSQSRLYISCNFMTFSPFLFSCFIFSVIFQSCCGTRSISQQHIKLCHSSSLPQSLHEDVFFPLYHSTLSSSHLHSDGNFFFREDGLACEEKCFSQMNVAWAGGNKCPWQKPLHFSQLGSCQILRKINWIGRSRTFTHTRTDNFSHSYDACKGWSVACGQCLRIDVNNWFVIDIW